MNKSPKKNNIAEIVEKLFKYGNTNYSQVASKLTAKNGNPMTRQVLYRMVKNGTISMSLFLEIVDIVGCEMKVIDSFPSICGSSWSVLDMEDVKGEKVKKKLKGVVYDSDKMFSVGGVVEVDEHRTDEMCFNPATKEFILIHYGDSEASGRNKYPYIEKYKVGNPTVRLSDDSSENEKKFSVDVFCNFSGKNMDN